MTKVEIAKCIAGCHNRLANAFTSGGITLTSADSVVSIGDTIKDLRSLVQQIMDDIKLEESREQNTDKK